MQGDVAMTGAGIVSRWQDGRRETGDGVRLSVNGRRRVEGGGSSGDGVGD